MPPKLRTTVAITRGGRHGRPDVPQVYPLLRTQAFAEHRSAGVHDRAARVVAAGLDAQHTAGVRSAGQGRAPGGRAAAESMRHSHGGGRVELVPVQSQPSRKRTCNPSGIPSQMARDVMLNAAAAGECYHARVIVPLSPSCPVSGASRRVGFGSRCGISCARRPAESVGTKTSWRTRKKRCRRYRC